MKTKLVSTRWTLATIVVVVALTAYEEKGALAQFSLQQNISCTTAAHFTVSNASSLGELYSYLDMTESCDVKPSISVDWVGTVQLNQSITVPSGVELQIRGEGYDFHENGVISNNSSSNSNNISINGGETSAMASVIRGSGSVRLFFVHKAGTLFISGMTLQNGWGGDEGGGGIYALGETTIVSDNCFWKSLSSKYNGGAIAANSMVNLTLSGINKFSNCSSSTRGGAIYLDNTTLSAQGSVRFDNCTTEGKGGGMYTERTSQLRFAEEASIYFSGCTAGSQSDGKGGGLCSYDTNITVGADARVSFEYNSASMGGNGGGLFAKNTSIAINTGANISFVNNRAAKNGGGMYLEAAGSGDMMMCLTLAEGANATFFNNSGGVGNGGGIYVSTGCGIVIAGGIHFELNIGEREGGAFYMDGAKAVISGQAIFVSNTAERWGGAIKVIDSDEGLELNGTVIFRNNSAGRSGGAVYLENTWLSITAHNNAEVLWEENSAGYDGGVIAVDGGHVYLQGGFASSNHASQRGGVIFSTGESSLSWAAGTSWDNSAASGGSLYISDSEVNITDVRLVGDHTPSSGVIFFAGANARVVNTSIVAPSQLIGDFALYIDDDSVVKLFSCSFEAWSGDYNLVVSEGQLVMDACDFSQSSNIILLRSSESTTVRNAILGDKNYDSVESNASTVFAYGASTCSVLPEAYSCLTNEHEQDCVDAKYGMGVFCTEYIAAATGENISLRGGGSPVELITTSVSASPSSTSSSNVVFFHPNPVTRELTLRYASVTGEAGDSNIEYRSSVERMATDAVLWELRSSNGGVSTKNGLFYDIASQDNFSWIAMPMSGILVKGQEVTIRLVGSPPPVRDPQRPSAVYNGEVSATFRVLSHTSEAGSTMLSNDTTLSAIFYYCQDGAYWDGEACVSCVELMSNMLNGDGSLECDQPGITLETLPLSAGYWRGDVNRTIVQPCLLTEACKGGAGNLSLSNFISSVKYSEDTRYCRTGYMGPYCAVCRRGFRQVSGYKCIDCQNDWGTAARVVFWFAIALTPVLLVSLVLFLFGGTTSFKQMRKKVSAACGWFAPAGVTQWSLEEGPQAEAARQGGEDDEAQEEASGHVSQTRGLSARVLRAIPFQQLKILIVVWQILTQFSSLAEVPYPHTYKRFLRTLDVFNFDLPWLMSAMCIVGKINFYDKLFIATIVPILMLGLLGLSYAGAMQLHRGTNMRANENRQQAKVRHASTALLVLFLVFSSVSTTIFSTFSCDYVEDLEVNLLRADYSISCDDKEHLLYQIYAGVMILVYPVGIPVIFAYLLTMHRDKINPLDGTGTVKMPMTTRVRALNRNWSRIEPSDEVDVADVSVPAAPRTHRNTYENDALRGRARSEVREPRAQHGVLPGSEGGSSVDQAPPRETKCATCGNDTLYVVPSVDHNAHRREALERRAHDFELQPTRFLWEPYEPRIFYFETVECGRRCLLTGVLVFVLPNTAGQMAGASIFAFVAILMFEMIRPHLCPADAWMYRIGCIIIFFSNFLGLMAKTDVSGEDAQSQEIFGVLLICVHAIMFIAILVQSYLAMQAASGSRDELLRRLVTEESSIRRSDGFRSSGLRMRVHPRIADGPRRRGIIRGENMRINQRVISTHGDQLGGVAHLEMGNARQVSR